MTGLVEFIKDHFTSEIALFLISMLPLIEVKGAIPIGFAMGLSVFKTYSISFVGSTLPAIFILIWIKKVFSLMARSKSLRKFVGKIVDKARRKDEKIRKYEYLGLFVFTALPLPGTGVWMGSLIAALLDLDKKKAFVTIALGNLLASFQMLIFSSIIF